MATTRHRTIKGQRYYDRGWTRNKADAQHYAVGQRKRGKRVRIVQGLNSTGEVKGYRILATK